MIRLEGSRMLASAARTEVSGGAALWLTGASGAMRVAFALALVLAPEGGVSAAEAVVGQVTLVSVGRGGREANADCVPIAISDDGRVVLMNSEANNLARRDWDFEHDAFVRDMRRRRCRLLVRGIKKGVWSGYTAGGDLSADGLMAAFSASILDLVPGGQDRDLYRQDRRTGRNILLTPADPGTNSEGYLAGGACMSGDGRCIVFWSGGFNISPDGSGGDDYYQVFGADVEGGEVRTLSVNAFGDGANANCGNAKISSNGRFVVFQSGASNLVDGDENGVQDVFRVDTETGQVVRVSVSSGGVEGDGDSIYPVVSDDGTVVFFSEAGNLVDGDFNGTWDVFMHDGGSGAMRRLSVNADGVEGASWSTRPSVSADGRSVVFTSAAENLVENDSNGLADVFLWEAGTGGLRLLSVARDGGAADGGSFSEAGSLSRNGEWCIFSSRATNLVRRALSGTVDNVFRVKVR
jgi:Tol biopolymer transport system component